MMNFRNRTKDVGLALLKLDKLSLQNLRKVGKSAVGGSKDSGPDDADYEKCKNLLDNSFKSEKEHVSRVATVDQDEGRKEKLETIVEHPLVEAEPRVEGLDVAPKLFGSERFKSPRECRRIKSFQLSKSNALEELACKLMNVPPSQIDSKLLDSEAPGKCPMVENLECDVSECPPQSFDDVYITEGEDILHLDNYTNLTPLAYRNYDLPVDSDPSERTFRAENTHPAHLDTDIVMSCRNEKTHDLNSYALPIRHEFIAYNMLVPPPLPPNETSISSQKWYEEDIFDTYYRDRTMPAYMRQNKLGRKQEDPSTAREHLEEGYRKYLSTLCESTTYQESLRSGKQVSEPSKKQDIPLSQLLKQVRQKNRIAQEMQKKKSKFDPTRYFSKSTCLPPLDLRPKPTTCSPKACPPRKKAPPKTAMPCPPPKKASCPPPKKDPCPPKSNPCDPCKPPPSCPARKSPCGFYTGNKFKDTISLILCGFNASSFVRRAFSLPMLLNSSKPGNDSTVQTLSTTSVANSKALGLNADTYMYTPIEISEDMASNISKILKVRNLGKKQRDIEAVYFARSFEPWSPIPSWPTTKTETRHKLVCPKEGCQAPKMLTRGQKEFPCYFKTANRKS